MTDDSLALAEVEAGITAEERRFVDAILADQEMNVSAGARAAGVDPATGFRWLKKGPVRAYMSRALAERRERYKDIRDGVIQALWQLATYDIAEAVDEDESFLDRLPETLDDALAFIAGGRLKPPHKLPPTLRAAVKSVKFGKFGWEYTFADRAQILLALAKHFGDIDHSASLSPSGGVVVETRKVVYYDTSDPGSHEKEQ